jgi:hypothetical protein
MPDLDRLYGLPGAESLDATLNDCYDRWRDDYADDDPATFADVVVRIEEWTIAPHRVPDYIIDYAVECVTDRMGDEGDEDYSDQWEEAAEQDDVKAAFRAAADLLASKVTYRMADELVATHVLTHDRSGRAFLAATGAPLYTTKVVDAGQPR